MESLSVRGPSSDLAVAAEAKAILCRAFIDDQLMTWMFPEISARAAGIERWLEFWIEFYGDKGVYTSSPHGAAIWARPGIREFDEEWGDRFFGIFKEEPRHRLGQLMTGLKGIEELPSPPNAWYLNAIAVLPDSRGSGLGRKLMVPTLELADAEGAAAYLDSSSHLNETFYLRLGFSKSDRIELPGSNERIQRMVREPR